METRPIGFLDSGLGGISVLGEAMRMLPNENFVYFGDTAHIPYGDKPPEEVYRYTHQAVEQLMEKGCKAIVIACNTATSVAAARLREEISTLPIIGMEPALKPASLLPGEGKVLVMATRVTLSLPKFESLMERYGQDAIPLPCPGLMECVEDGEFSGNRVETLLKSLFAPHLHQPIKAVVLGCTHYPFLKSTIRRFFPETTMLVDGSEGTVRQLARRLAENGLLSDACGGQVEFLSSLPGEEPLLRMRQMLKLWQRLTASSNQ